MADHPGAGDEPRSDQPGDVSALTGIASFAVLAEGGPSDEWGHVFLPDAFKSRLLSTAVFTLCHAHRLSRSRGAPQGLALLCGPPGTGKTTAARGLAHEVSRLLRPHGKTVLVEVDPHDLPSDLLGQSQRNALRLFERTVPELAAHGDFTVVIVNEIESLAIGRAGASMGANPADLHRATDAVLMGLDGLAREDGRIFLVGTTNFAEAVDQAVHSRADEVLEFPLPDDRLRRMIIEDSLRELAAVWPEHRRFLESPTLTERLVRRSAGWDGRRLRKAVVGALRVREQVALDPTTLEEADFERSAGLG